MLRSNKQHFIVLILNFFRAVFFLDHGINVALESFGILINGHSISCYQKMLQLKSDLASWSPGQTDHPGPACHCRLRAPTVGIPDRRSQRWLCTPTFGDCSNQLRLHRHLDHGLRFLLRWCVNGRALPGRIMPGLSEQ
jgi:hypothetical protein